jgi:uncharacterized membrane protein
MSIRTSDSGNTGLKKTLQHHKLNPDDHKHPVNVVHHDQATFGELLADKIAAGIGSWKFLIIQTCASWCSSRSTSSDWCVTGIRSRSSC